MLDITKANAAIDTALVEINTITDTLFKIRQLEGMRSLTTAAKHLEDAQKFLGKAVDQTTPKAAAGAKA